MHLVALCVGFGSSGPLLVIELVEVCVGLSWFGLLVLSGLCSTVPLLLFAGGRVWRRQL